MRKKNVIQSPRERLEAQEAGVASSGQVGLILELEKRKRRGRDGKKKEWKQRVTTGSIEEVPGCRAEPQGGRASSESPMGHRNRPVQNLPCCPHGSGLPGRSTGSCSTLLIRGGLRGCVLPFLAPEALKRHKSNSLLHKRLLLGTEMYDPVVAPN